jgi:hypothetical protein
MIHMEQRKLAKLTMGQNHVAFIYAATVMCKWGMDFQGIMIIRRVAGLLSALSTSQEGRVL